MPFRVPSICDSCQHKHATIDPFSLNETCNAFPAGIPTEITQRGAEHFSTEGQGNAIEYEQREDGADQLAIWLSFWYTIEDGNDLEEGVEGLLPSEFNEGDL